MKKDYTRVPVVIPALNPDERLLTFIDDLISEGFIRIILVDDGSEEEYKKTIFKDADNKEYVSVLTLDENQGKGSASKLGFSFVYDNYKDAVGVVTADYDGRQGADEVALVADELLKGESFVLGCRDVLNSNLRVGLKRMHKFLRFAFKLLYGKKIEDIQSGLRGVCYDLIPMMLEIKGSRYEYATKMIIEIVRAEIQINQVEVGRITPIDAKDEELLKSDNFRPFKDSIRIIVSLFLNFIKYAMTSIIATAVDFTIFYVLSNHIFAGLDLSMCVLVSTVLARVVSVSISFCINRKVVFKSDVNLVRNMIMYYSLAAIIMLASAGLVTFFVYIFGGGKTFTKLFVDLCLFFVSYQIQQRVIFRKDLPKIEKNS